MQPNHYHPEAVDSGLKRLWTIKGGRPQGPTYKSPARFLQPDRKGL
jgi:hypothetical protein